MLPRSLCGTGRSTQLLGIVKLVFVRKPDAEHQIGQSKFKFWRCIREVSVDASTHWLTLAMQTSKNVQKEWMKRRMSVHIDKRQGESHLTCSYMCADKHWIMSHSTMHLRQMMEELIDETERWDLEPTPGSLWLTRTYTEAHQEDMMIKTKKDLSKFLSEKKLQNPWVYVFYPASKTQDSLEERTQHANKPWWRDRPDNKRCAVEDTMQKHGGTRPQHVLILQ